MFWVFENSTCLSVESMLKRKYFLPAKKHNASASTLAGDKKDFHPGGRKIFFYSFNVYTQSSNKAVFHFGSFVTRLKHLLFSFLFMIKHCDLPLFNIFVYYWNEKMLIENLLEQLQSNIQMETFKTFEIFKNPSRDCLKRLNKSWQTFSEKLITKGTLHKKFPKHSLVSNFVTEKFVYYLKMPFSNVPNILFWYQGSFETISRNTF